MSFGDRVGQELRLNHNRLTRMPTGCLKEPRHLQRLYLEHNKIGAFFFFDFFLPFVPVPPPPPPPPPRRRRPSRRRLSRLSRRRRPRPLHGLAHFPQRRSWR